MSRIAARFDESRGSLEALVRAGAILAATTIAFGIGHVAGTGFRDAAYVLQEFSAIWTAWLAALLIPIIPAGILGATGRGGSARALSLIGLVALVASALLLGFAMATGIGEEEGFPQEGVLSGVVAVSLIAAAGAGAGYAIARRLARPTSRTLSRAWQRQGQEGTAARRAATLATPQRVSNPCGLRPWSYRERGTWSDPMIRRRRRPSGVRSRAPWTNRRCARGRPSSSSAQRW